MAIAVNCGLTSCNDFLDREPLSQIAPEAYFKDAGQVLAYTDEMYDRILPDCGGNSYGIYGWDIDTDNQLKADVVNTRFDDGEWKVGQSGGNWAFETIYRCNYFFSMVNPKFGEDLSGSQNTISGNLNDIRHYIGEMYVLRALEYFSRYQNFGDYPVITEPLSDEMAALTEASKRAPRNEVARFILSDLDKAITLMDGTDHNTTRINRDVALLIKSRVALYEGTWLKYFKGTAFVPNGEGWPGKSKDYNAGYQYPSGSIDSEIDWFLEQTMAASKEVAEKYKGNLTANTGDLQQSASDPKNPYFDMYISVDLSSVKEVLLWRRFASTVKMHGIAVAGNVDNNSTGVTRSFVQNFLMADGKPVYAHGSYAEGDDYYKGDKSIADVRVNRDSRLSLFLKEPEQINILGGTTTLNVFYEEPYPDVLGIGQYRYPTGYGLRKGTPFDIAQYITMNGSFTGVPLYRSAEALLNYMEASYERNGTLDGSTLEYWKLIRQRAKVSDDIDATISATDISKEAENDWGAYSGGSLIDATLYNIRRERRSEFIAEGIRYMDLCRWRAMDQMITTPYIPEGMHFWNSDIESWYDAAKIIANGSDKANISPASQSEYIRPFQKRQSQRCYNGFIWHLAHYLEPIAIKHFQITSPDGATVDDSPIYQNPYWPIEAAQPAEQ
jgi:hypothetical protein